ncbi:putative CCCH zinc finger in TRM13 protein U11 48K like CHHC zinc finger Methyltransferase TRM13 [Trypanosoma vivax]|uniref:tRNA:m(4)X modification enzyme TRM13 n=1 Tax=Trypanosoma vivax (strain Y486) TaxID=1055687 RepID=G0TUS3_TRYVY|nr:putative CCCH zinc finger in TRM13 protein U11 48K like CHHC zinc finger Methyltransferase TRM13 [Trypanosoma vivax]CCC47709.1 conserved hypothetical protein [Trypanosoma vivax Y486]
MVGNPGGIPTVNPEESVCDFYLTRKRRFCRTAKRSGSRYCPTHDITFQSKAENEIKNVEYDNYSPITCANVDADAAPDVVASCGAGCALSRKPLLQRVPCPINPNHTVYAAKLERHVKICPDLRFVVNELPYYRKDMHAFRGKAYHATEYGNTGERFTHHQMDNTELHRLISRVQQCYTSFIKPHIVLMSEECSEPHYAGDNHGVNSSENFNRRESCKHSPQHRALLRCVERALESFGRRQVHENGAPAHVAGFLEVGAGKGGLSVALQRALISGQFQHCFQKNSSSGDSCGGENPTVVYTSGKEVARSSHFPSIVLVDVDNFRRKRDACVRDSCLPLTRLRLNIKDLDLVRALRGLGTRKRTAGELTDSGVDGVSSLTEGTCNLTGTDYWVAVGKHLCGSCTDFALSCITSPNLITEGPISVCAVVLATCCHQRCELQHINALRCEAGEGASSIAIPGTPYRFSPNEFAAIASMSSWAVSGSFVDTERQSIGVCCKGVIDTLRIAYLKQCGYRDAFICHYIDRHVTAENNCIVAFR